MSSPNSNIRNIGIIAHINAGKTTTTESILFHTGQETRFGNVEEGTSVTDYLQEEVNRGISIISALVSCSWKKVSLNIVDTPGHVDFTGEVEKTLRVLDGGVGIFSAIEGVQAQTEAVWRQADHYQIPRLAFVNKMDRVGADFSQVLQSIQQNFDIYPLALQLPVQEDSQFVGLIDLIEMEYIDFSKAKVKTRFFPTTKEIPESFQVEAEIAREEFFEAISEHISSVKADLLLERYLEKGSVARKAVLEVIREGMEQKKIVPVYCGSAVKNQGISHLLDGILSLLPSPDEQKEIIGFLPDTEEKISFLCKAEAPFCGLVFKIFFEVKWGLFALIRIYSGVLKPGAKVWNPIIHEEETIEKIWRVYASEREELEEGRVGEIVGISGLQHTSTGDTLCEREQIIQLEKRKFPEPVISLVIEPKNAQERAPLISYLERLAKEDPTFRFQIERESEQCIISGMGELHLEVLAKKIQKEVQLEVNIGLPRVLYKEGISGVVRGEGKIEKEISGQEHYGHVEIEISPLEEMEGVEIENNLKEGLIPKEFYPSLYQGLEAAIHAGGRYGYPLTRLKICIIGGSSGANNSRLGFQRAAKFALNQALRDAKPVHFEPLMHCEVFFPEKFQGSVLGELQQRKAKILATEIFSYGVKLEAEVSLKDMFGYSSSLRTITQGRGTYYMELLRYKKTQLMGMEYY